jgi:quercetin dioxygenase-like cupin family protein
MKNEINQNTYIEFMDAVIAAPDHHRVIFENEQVRVMELKVNPGEIVPVHTHRWATVNYVLSHSDFLSFDADGNVKLDSRTDESGMKEGAVFCLPPNPPLHSVKNIGAGELRGITVELKD